MTAGRLREMIEDLGDDAEIVILHNYFATWPENNYTTYEITDVPQITHFRDGTRMPQEAAFFAIEAGNKRPDYLHDGDTPE